MSFESGLTVPSGRITVQRECVTRCWAMAKELVITVIANRDRCSTMWNVVEPPSIMMVSPSWMEPQALRAIRRFFSWLTLSR